MNRKNNRIIYLAYFMVFGVSFLYLYGFGDHLFFFQENNALFICSGEYFRGFVTKPGGLLEYAGNFLSQGYFSAFYGAVVLSGVLTLLAVVVSRVHHRLVPDAPFESAFVVVIPSLVLLLMQIDFIWFMWGNLGILLTFLYFSWTVRSVTANKEIPPILFFPVFYYLTGGFAWFYLGMYITYSLVYRKNRSRYLYPALMVAVAGITFFVFQRFLFLQPVEVILFSPFSPQSRYRHMVVFYVLIMLVITFPFLEKTLSSGEIRKKNHSPKTGLPALLAVFIVFMAALFFLYDPKDAKLFRLEKYVYERKWDELIRYQEKHRLKNLVAEYYYNVALSEKGLLCDRMFFGPQNYGPRSLFIPWITRAGSKNLARGFYAYYAAGLISEAHRWAYESMVVQGYRPENLKYLIKTDLINGHYKTAAKYLNILEKTWHYRKWAGKYKKMLYHPELVKSDPELGYKIKLLSGKDFTTRINDPRANLVLLTEGNPHNTRAYEYLMAWFLLEKNIKAVVKEAGKLKKTGYTRIPRHIEEALVVYNVTTGKMPDLGELEISRETVKRFEKYETLADPLLRSSSGKKRSIPAFARVTYWYYLDFVR